MAGWLVCVHNFTGRNESVFGALRDAAAGSPRWMGTDWSLCDPGWLCSVTLDALGDKRSQKDSGKISFSLFTVTGDDR